MSEITKTINERGLIPLIDFIMEKRGIDNYSEFLMLCVENFLAQNNYDLPKDFRSIPDILRKDRIREMLNKEVEDLKTQAGFIKGVDETLNYLMASKSEVADYEHYYYICRKTILTMNQKKVMIKKLNKRFKDHLLSVIKQDENITQKCPLKKRDIINFTRKKLVKDEKELIGFINDIKVIG